MRRNAAICVCAALALAAAQAHATVIAWDDFESYTAGTDLNGGGGGGGAWTTTWAATASEAIVQAGVIPTFGQSAQINTVGEDKNIASRSFTPQTDTVYVGLLVRTTGGWESDDFLQFYLNGSAGASENSGVSGGIKSNAYFARIDGSGNTNGSAAGHPEDTTQQVVLKLSRSGANYDSVEVFVNRPDETTADATQTSGNSGVSALATFHVRTHSLDAADFVYIDGIKIADTYADALSITPEPPPPTPVIPATAYASTSHPINNRRPPANVVNGSGMTDEDADGIPETHAASSFGDYLSWMTDSFSNDPDPWIALDLGEVAPLDLMKVWNFNATAGNSNRGVGTADLYMSILDDVGIHNTVGDDPDFSDTAIWTLLQRDIRFALAPGADGYDRPDDIALGGIQARWLALDIQLPPIGGSSVLYVGLSEIQVFREDQIPEPATLTLLALGSLALLRRRRAA